MRRLVWLLLLFVLQLTRFLFEKQTQISNKVNFLFTMNGNIALAFIRYDC